MTEVRSAELAARAGRWRLALEHWSKAEEAGYKDSIYLGLSRAEAWSVLDEPKRSEAELIKLMRRPDLGAEKGRVLLRMGEHELFDQRTSESGVKHVIQALGAGLGPDDEAFAKGLLTQSSTAALTLFQKALLINPYHHGAHVAVVGLEFLLGEHNLSKTEGQIFRTLYPDDTSPAILEAMEFASQNRLRDAQNELQSIAGKANQETLNRLNLVLRKLSAAAAYYDLNTFLNTSRTNSNIFTAETEPFALTGDLFSIADTNEPIRLPQLPCVKEGLMESLTGVRILMNPLLTDPRIAVQRVHSGWDHHHEALFPLLAGLLLDHYRAMDSGHSTNIISLQAGLFQLAADSPSILAGVPRLARFLAAKTEFEIAKIQEADDQSTIRLCLRNLTLACASQDCSSKELAAYFDYAYALGNYDLARALIVQWQKQEPQSRPALQERINLEIAVGAYEAAAKDLDLFLDQNPTDSWAKAQKATLQGKMSTLFQSLR